MPSRPRGTEVCRLVEVLGDIGAYLSLALAGEAGFVGILWEVNDGHTTVEEVHREVLVGTDDLGLGDDPLLLSLGDRGDLLDLLQQEVAAPDDGVVVEGGAGVAGAHRPITDRPKALVSMEAEAEVR